MFSPGHFGHTATPKRFEPWQKFLQVTSAWSSTAIGWTPRQPTEHAPSWAQGARKRSAPTPAVSSQATPQEVNEAAAQGSASGPAASAQGFVVQGPHLEDHTGFQITAAHMGKDVNNPKEVEAFLNSKVTTTRDVLRLVKNYHESIIRPELYGAVVQLETAMGKMSDRLFSTQAELRFMASDNRQQQKAESGLKILLTGWPVTMPPQGRAYMIGWMLSQVPEIRQFMMNPSRCRPHRLCPGVLVPRPRHRAHDSPAGAQFFNDDYVEF